MFEEVDGRMHSRFSAYGSHLSMQKRTLRDVTLCFSVSKILRYHYNVSSCSNKADPNKVFAHDLRLKLAIFIVKSVPFLANIFHWVK